MRQKQRNKPITLQRKVSVTLLKQEIGRTIDEKCKTHLRAILLFKQGRTKQEIAHVLVTCARSVRRWIVTYNQIGKEGLKTKPTGRPKGREKRDGAIFTDLAKEIDTSEKYWSVPLMAKWIKENKKETIPEQTVWYRMTQIGYSHKSSRPYPYKGDVKKQEEFDLICCPFSFKIKA